MGIIEIILIGVSLSMDAFAVALSNGICYELSKKQGIAILLFFGGFQGIMPLLGFYTGGIFSQLIQQYTGIVIFLILGIIGFNMLYGSFKKEEEKKEEHFTLKVLFFQAVATSLDAFAVGITFSAGGVNIFSASTIIAVTTVLICFAALLIGKKCNRLLGKKAEMFGGVILLLLAIKALIL